MAGINRFAGTMGAIVVLLDEWWSALRSKLRRWRAARVAREPDAVD